jgi:hypothetical protein
MEIRETLNLGPIKIENCTQRTVSIIARKGWGKSQTLKMLAYSAPLDLPCFIFDPLGKIQIEGFKSVVITKKVIADEVNLIKICKLFNKIQDKKIIFSFRDLLQSEIVIFINAFFQNWHPKNCLIFADEVQDICPEKGMGLTFSEEFERAVRHWRNDNVGFIIATQRPAFTSKRVLALTDLLIVGAVTWPNDKKVLEELISDMLTKEETEAFLQKIQTKDFLDGYLIDFQNGGLPC